MNMTSKNNKVLIYFKLQGEFDPDEVTEAIGISPTSVLIKGSRDPIKILPKVSIWEYSSGELSEGFIDVYQVSSNLLKNIFPHADKIAELVESLKITATLQVVLWLTARDNISTPPLGFDVEVIRFLSKVGATIDVDTYLN